MLNSTRTMVAAVALAACGAVQSPAAADARAPGCTTGQLKITAHGNDGSASMYVDTLLFRNLGRPCTLYGYPQVQLLDRHGHVVRHVLPVSGDGESVSVVRLARGQVAHARVDGVHVEPKIEPCPGYVAYRVILPGAATSVRLKAPTVGMCLITVDKIEPGDFEV